jgi:hypothetical protein
MRTGLILASVLISLTVQPAFAGIGRVKKVAGSAVVERAGQKLPVQPGFVLEKGDRLITGRGGKVGVTFNDNTRFAAGSNSDVSVPEYNFDDTTHQGQFIANVNKGAVAIISGEIAHSAKDAMKVRTPTALLGIRGTRFVVEVR